MAGLLLPGPALVRAQAPQEQAPQARIDAAMDAAARAGIPALLLSSKVAEGEAKRVPRDRIAAAVESRLAALVQAAGVLRRAEVTASPADLAVAADALSAGVSEDAVRDLARTAPPERRVVAMAVLADLVRLGQSHEQALARVRTAAGAQGTLANLQAEVASSAALANLQAEVASRGVDRTPAVTVSPPAAPGMTGASGGGP